MASKKRKSRKSVKRIDREKKFDIKSFLQEIVSRSDKKNRYNKTHELLAILLLVILGIITYMCIFDSKLDMGGDNASFYNLARALSEFKGYVELKAVKPVPHGHYPPGYSILIAPFFWLSDSIIFIKSINGLLLIISVVLVFKLIPFFVRVNLGTRLLIAVAVLTNFTVLRYSTIMMSEIPLAAFLLVILYLMSKEEASTNSWKLSKSLVLISALSVFAFHIKSLALPILAATFIFLLQTKRWKTAVTFTACSALFMLPWMLRNQYHGFKSSYLKQIEYVNPYRPELGFLDFNSLQTRIIANIERYISKEIPAGLFPIQELGPNAPSSSMYFIAGFIGLVLILTGLSSLKRLRIWILIYLLGTLSILLVWPEVWFGTRFLVPSIPLLLMLLFIGLRTLFVQLDRLKKGVSPAVLTISMILFIIWNLGLLNFNNTQTSTVKDLMISRSSEYPAGFKNYFDLAKWARDNLDPKDAISCRKPALFHIFSNGKTNRYAYTDDPDKFFKSLENSQAKYIVVEQIGFSSTNRYVVPRINEFPDKFKLIHQIPNPDTYIFELVGLNYPDK